MVLVRGSEVWFAPRRVRSQEKRRLGGQGHYLMGNNFFPTVTITQGQTSAEARAQQQPGESPRPGAGSAAAPDTRPAVLGCPQLCAYGHSRSSRAAPQLDVTLCTAFSARDVQKALTSSMYISNIYLVQMHVCVSLYKGDAKNRGCEPIFFHSTRDGAAWDAGHGPSCPRCPHTSPPAPAFPGFVPPGRAQPGWDSEAPTGEFGIYVSIS